jgi:deoxycytidylate deaminase
MCYVFFEAPTKQFISKKNTTLIVVRYTKDGLLCDSKPCYNCIKLIILLNIKWIVYSNSLGQLIKIRTKDISINEYKPSKLMSRLNMKCRWKINGKFQ